MAHLHEIRDNDSHFIIDPETRNVTNRTGKMVTVMQYDHLSERVTFEIPRIIEGHDMSLSDIVQVFYENTSRGTSASKRVTAIGAKLLEDLAPAEDDPDILVFSWLISQETTQLDGTISFQIRFVCHGDDELDVPDYSWRTNLCTAFNVLSSLDTANDVIEANPDLFTDLYRRLDQIERNGVSDDRLNAAITKYFIDNPVRDGESAYEIAVKNGFVGTEEEWLESLKGTYNTTTVKLDFSNWENGSFTETLQDGTVYEYGVTFDDRDIPIAFKLPDGRIMDVVIPEFEEEETPEEGEKPEDGDEPVEGISYYSFNGVTLPVLPEWDSSYYKYAMITTDNTPDDTGAIKYYLSISHEIPYQNSDGYYVIPYPSIYTGCKMLNGEAVLYLDNGGWSEFIEREEDAIVQYTAIWFNAWS